MGMNLIYVGIDVDTKNYHGCALNNQTGEMTNFKVDATSAALIKELRKMKKKGFAVRACYEAGFLGFSLQRDLEANGFNCEVIAPSNIPRRPGRNVKTDRIDAERLAEFYSNGQLTFVHRPDADVEAERSLLRTRMYLQNQLSSVKRLIAAICRKQGWDYARETAFKKNWTREHLIWVEGKAGSCSIAAVRANLLFLMEQYKSSQKIIDSYTEEIERLSNSEKYQKQVRALACYRGLDIIQSMTLITEIENIKRFSHPRSLMSYAGLDIAEYSSGGKSNRFGVTKQGNKFIRTALVEASQYNMRLPRETKHLRARRLELKSTTKEIEIADRCMQRLYKKTNRLIRRGKHVNTIKVACARELAGFIWESLKL